MESRVARLEAQVEELQRGQVSLTAAHAKVEMTIFTVGDRIEQSMAAKFSELKAEQIGDLRQRMDLVSARNETTTERVGRIEQRQAATRWLDRVLGSILGAIITAIAAWFSRGHY